MGMKNLNQNPEEIAKNNRIAVWNNFSDNVEEIKRIANHILDVALLKIEDDEGILSNHLDSEDKNFIEVYKQKCKNFLE